MRELACAERDVMVRRQMIREAIRFEEFADADVAVSLALDLILQSAVALRQLANDGEDLAGLAAWPYSG
jgi:hypothetical protein